MTKNLITTILGLALLTLAPSMAQDTTLTPAEQAARPTEVKVVQTQADSTELTLNLKDESIWILRPVLQKVGDVPTRPHGRSRHDKAPEEKPLIYVDGFENQWD